MCSHRRAADERAKRLQRTLQKTSGYNISRVHQNKNLSVPHTERAARKVQVPMKRLYILQEALGRPNI